MKQILRFFFGGVTKPGSVRLPISPDQRTPQGFDPSAKLGFEETVAQMSRGFDNTQRVIQFMDAKAGAVIALCLGIFVLTGKLAVGVYDRLGEGMLTSHSMPDCLLIWGIATLILLVGITGFASLHHAFQAVRPNGLPQPEHFTTLFPAGKQPWNTPRLTTYLENVVRGEDQRFVVDEFRRQLLALGDIVYRKIESLKKAITVLWWQGLFSFLLLGFIGVMVGFDLYPKKPDAQPVQELEAAGQAQERGAPGVAGEDGLMMDGEGAPTESDGTGP